MQNEQPKTAKPVAYDSEGRPLYYEAPQQPTVESNALISSKPTTHEGHNFNPKIRTQYANEPSLVHAEREIEPKVAPISDQLKRRHDESVRRYPSLNLSKGEFVILEIKRHPIGLLLPVLATAVAVIILVTLMLLLPDVYNFMQLPSATGIFPSQELVTVILLLLTLLSVGIGGASVWIYQKNQFFLTNESVIQQIQHSLFSHHEQTVSLGSIEDASFKKQGIIQHLFNYGLMRLSTEGEETTYRFAFVENPKQQVAIVSNAVEAFKNGRPVSD